MLSRGLIKLFIVSLLFSTKMVFATCLGLGCTCTIAATNLSFGTYAPLSGLVDNATGTVSVTCSAIVIGLLVAYTIDLSKGGSASYTPRTMASGANHLNYNIYTDSAHTQIWGNTTGGTVDVSDSYLLTVSPTIRNYTAFGQIPASQTTAVPGSYTDTITATVTF